MTNDLQDQEMERVVIKEASVVGVHLLGSSPNHLCKIFEIIPGRNRGSV